MQINVDLIYPIGSLYITTDTSFNPNIKFGGTNYLNGKIIFLNSAIYFSNLLASFLFIFWLSIVLCNSNGNFFCRGSKSIFW